MNMEFRYKVLTVLLMLGTFSVSVIWFSTRDKNNIKQGKKFDTVIYVHDTVYIEKKSGGVKNTKPIPSVTKYKVTDWVCAWDKWSGVIIDIKWSDNNPTVLVYTVQSYDETNGWVENPYYDTELTLGKCD